MISKVRAGVCRAHNVQFYNLQSRAITCMAYNNKLNKLALSRDDGTIEFWNLYDNPVLEKSIPGGEGRSVEGLAWSRDRLFLVGLSGYIEEWNSKTLELQRHVLTTGYAAWCIDISPDGNRVAVGTEGGYINIYNLEHNDINYEKILDKQEGRVICCKFNNTGEFLVTGSADAVRVWNLNNGHAVHKMTTGRSDPNKETTVWTLAVLSDFTIISGDSRGKITFYDGNLGTVVESISVSKADILSLILNDTESVMFCTGVEPIIRTFQKIDVIKKDAKIGGFVRSVNRTNLHTNDTKALAMKGDALLSGGNDGNLVISSYPPKIVNKYPPYLELPSVSVTDESRLVLLKYINYIEIWRLGSASFSNNNDNDEYLNVESGSEKLVQVRSKNDDHIVCTSISDDGRWVIYSTSTIIRLFKLELAKSGRHQHRLVQMKTLPDQFEASYRVEFTNDSKGIFLFKNNGVIDYFTFNDNEDFDFKQTINISKSIQERVHLVKISKNDKYMVLAGLCNSISIWVREKSNRWKCSYNLPKYKCPASAIDLNQNSTILAAVFPDNKIFYFDYEEFTFLFSSFLDQKPDKKHPIRSILFDPRNDDVLLLQRENTLSVLKFAEDDDENENCENKQKKKSVNKHENDANTRKYSVTDVGTYANFITMAYIGSDEFIAIEANPVSIKAHESSAFKAKVYGRS